MNSGETPQTLTGFQLFAGRDRKTEINFSDVSFSGRQGQRIVQQNESNPAPQIEDDRGQSRTKNVSEF